MQPTPAILLIDVLQQMDSGALFDIAFVEYDVRRGKGGKLRQIKGWLKVKKEQDDDLRVGIPGERINQHDGSYNPEHMANETVNIYNPKDFVQHITKVHWQLITRFNNQVVIS